MKRNIVIVIVLLIVFGFSMCKKPFTVAEENNGLTPYEIKTPERFPTMVMNPKNPMTEEGVALGRKLFYDNILHKDLANSCSSCHQQEFAFTTPGSNALAHINLGYNPTYLWNGYVEGNMEDIMKFEVEDFFETKPERLNIHEEYPTLFKKAFNVDVITNKEIEYALAQFMRTMISSDSKFDRFLRSEMGLSPEETSGMGIFFSEKGDCFHCHGTALLTDNLFHNTGLDLDADSGRYAVTLNPLEKGAFKSPTLRNIEFTGPYMHDGRFNTLEEVVDFYSEGIKPSPTIDPLMKQVNQGGVRLTPQEKSDLVAFLKTFSDSSFITNPSLSNPN